MEKLYAVKGDAAYAPVILLDTPPTPSALDFLDAPEQLIGALDSAATRWFVQAFQSSGKLSFNLLAKSTAAILRGIGKVTGDGFLEQIASFINEINEIFGELARPRERVARRAAHEDVAYVLIGDARSVERARGDPLRRSPARAGHAARRVRGEPRAPGVRQGACGERRGGRDRGAQARARARRGRAPAPRGGRRDAPRQDGPAIHLMALEGALEDETSSGSLAVHVPAFPYDIYDLVRLARVADLLAPM